MNSQIFSVFGIFLVLILDLITIAARSALQHANLARVLQLRTQMEVEIGRTLALMNYLPRPHAGLHIVQSFARFVLVGLILTIIPWTQNTWTTVAVLAVFLSFGLLTVWLEWIVERVVARDPEIWVIRLALFTQILTTVLYPLVNLSLLFSQDTSSSNDTAGTVTEDELKTLVEAGQQEGILEQEERQMIFSVFQLGDTLTREIMVPRIDVRALDIHTPLPEAVDALLESGYSRMPFYEGRVDDIIGVLYAKDLLKVWREGNGQKGNVRNLLREAYFVPEAKKVDELFAEMQSRHVHMAIVVDEYGGVAGVVTMEDIVEEIFGEIQDEYDEEDLPYQVLENGDYLFRGRIDLDDFNGIMECNLPRDEADTLSGFIYGRLGHVPVADESVQVDNLLLTVEQVSSRRIRKVRAQRISSHGQSDVD
ncbi:MAG: hemolysin family protein [Chloroflexi bacterium]|nr:hemolysin family protein [Chloroflexota bacterium]